MAFATSFTAANRAADHVKVKWQSGETANVSEQDIQQRAAELIADTKGGSLFVDDPDVDTVLALAEEDRENLHDGHGDAFCPEAGQRSAFEKDGILEIHTGNQWQSSILPVLAKALRRNQDKIVMRSYLLGGAFGRRLDGDYAVPAALATMAIGKPVKMVCTRADDMRFDCPRSASRQVLRLAWGDGHRVAAMDHHAAAGWPSPRSHPIS